MENNNKDIRYLKAMLQFVDEIQEIASRQPLVDILDKPDVELSAIMMKLTQIGELVGRLSFNTIENYPDVPWIQIKGLRNTIVHEYEKVDREQLKDVITTDLDSLKDMLNDVVRNELRRTRNEF
ncbi:hypothetical protein WOSG25_190170 [Weissella oryzae SG25]|uniref:Toxin-antitoxin system antitoxin component n=1 Tax=Weissella oryzae (strain DSM 25784 / JCM 18191 / LMG 30913 / SG25) TaxID=1329250 RepID=A0A069CWR6_WEIOS|nr:HepT-like ribonuclease domain-containing protein [Weissella oryzae]GAK31909.1 hypothetical protein WOSG25_190170 [Weissella oryzae SG25]